MPRFASRLAALASLLLLAACASRPLPKYQKPIARAPVQHVRTTAYTHSEADHIKHGRKTAMGTTLQAYRMRSAAADWSRWPAGTIFRIVETGEIYRVDDYGWALAGTNTIDLYKPTRAAMNSWGVRHVTIQNLIWGDVDTSLRILRSRSKYKHVRRMLKDMERRYAELKKPLGPQVAEAAPAPARTAGSAASVPVRAVSQSRVALSPFQAGR